MFIQTEETPNPASLKFLPGRPVMPSGTADFASAGEAENAPLARRLFAVEGVAGVFLGPDFVTVTKRAEDDWQMLKPPLLGVLMEHFTSGDAAVGETAPVNGAGADDDDEVVAQIKDLLETRVRPAVAQDGGDIVFQGFEDGVVYLHMRGACAGCPSASATLKHGIENMLRHYVPEVIAVEQA
ncbi:MAG: NifU family protein [Alphaproteobacteria bacterium]